MKQEIFEKDKETFTLRIPIKINHDIKKLSTEIGISQNALILSFIYLGLQSYSNIIVHQKEEFLHFLSEIPK